MNDTATDHLRLIADHWDDLHDALTARQTSDWPPTMGIAKMRDDEDGDRLGDVQRLPIRPEVFDAMQAITRALVELADQVAAEVQRSPAPAFRSASPLDEVGLQLALLTARDAADAARWSYHGQRTAPGAARWLLARLDGEPGPFRPLHDGHRERIADIAAACAVTVQRILRTARQAVSTGQQCACGGELEIHGGDGEPPAVRCDDCGRTWTDRTTTAA